MRRMRVDRLMERDKCPHSWTEFWTSFYVFSLCFHKHPVSKSCMISNVLHKLIFNFNNCADVVKFTCRAPTHCLSMPPCQSLLSLHIKISKHISYIHIYFYSRSGRYYISATSGTRASCDCSKFRL